MDPSVEAASVVEIGDKLQVVVRRQKGDALTRLLHWREIERSQAIQKLEAYAVDRRVSLGGGFDALGTYDLANDCYVTSYSTAFVPGDAAPA
jgi:hypothetical protein